MEKKYSKAAQAAAAAPPPANRAELLIPVDSCFDCRFYDCKAHSRPNKIEIRKEKKTKKRLTKHAVHELN